MGFGRFGSCASCHELLDGLRGGAKLTFRAVWTRFHPIAYAVQDVIFSGKLGKVKRFQADFSMFFDIESGSTLSASLCLK